MKVDNGKMINPDKDDLDSKWEFEGAMDVDLLRSIRKDLREKLYKSDYNKSAAK